VYTSYVLRGVVCLFNEIFLLKKKKKKKKVKLLTLNVSGAKEGTDVQCVKRARFLCRGFFGVDKWLS